MTRTTTSSLMKTLPIVLSVLFLSAVAMMPLAAAPALELNVDALPTAPLLLELADLETIFMSGGTCAKIRPVALHSDCTLDLCESRGCGAPSYFDAVDCACYCSFGF